MIISRMLSCPLSSYLPSAVISIPGAVRKLSQLIFLALLMLGAASPLYAQSCPSLAPYYPNGETHWPTLERELRLLMPACLQSTEYFALLGAAQMNVGNVAGALEALERALLLEPANGAAQIDYAQALFMQGQLFSALELNRQLLERRDLPEDLQPLLQERQYNWQGMTRQKAFQADVLAGYDNNLNGAPAPGQITLTLSGEPVVLPLSREFRPVSGPYLNLRLAGRYRQLAPEHQHNVLVEMRGRVSEHTESDLLQLDARYAFIKPGRQRSWQLGGGISHLSFGGSPLYTASEVSGRYVPDMDFVCRPYLSAASQHQLYHGESSLDALESKAGAGMSCPFSTALGRQQWVSEFSLLHNNALSSGRPGGSRRGWQFSSDWQLALPAGMLSAQINHTELDDKRGYSSLLAGGAERWLTRSYVLLQYRQPLRPYASLMVNLYHQKQRSNIELFQSRDTTAEIGVSFAF